MDRADAEALGFVDVTSRCNDCGVDFIWTAGEQLFYDEKGLSAPRRCRPCRDQKREHAVAGRRRWQPNPWNP